MIRPLAAAVTPSSPSEMVGGPFKSASGVGTEMFGSESRTSNSARVDSELEGTGRESIGGVSVELPASQVVRDCGKKKNISILGMALSWKAQEK